MPGLKYSLEEDYFLFGENLPTEWSFMEFDVPVVRPDGGEQTRINQYRQFHTPSAPPAVYSIPDVSRGQPPQVSYNAPAYEEATTGNVYWDLSAPNSSSAKKIVKEGAEKSPGYSAIIANEALGTFR